jgi:nitrogen fixation/metabolism regulation signal transduction histidine kinase
MIITEATGEKNWQVDSRFSQAVLDALPANVAVLNREGEIIAVNRSWRRFADENGGLLSTGIGVNYLDVARQAAGPYSDEAQAAYRGLCSLRDGSAQQFSLEYPCHCPTRKRWFLMQATRVEGIEPLTIVVMHHDISERKRAEDDLRAHTQQVCQLAASLDTRLRQQQAVAELGKLAFQTADLDTLLTHAVRTISQVLDAEFC